MHFEHPEISHHLMDCAIKQSSHQFDKIFFRISKCLGCNGEKSLEDNKGNEYSQLDKYICKIHIPILYATRMTQNKNDSINSILHHGRGSISYFWISIFDPVSQTVQMERSYHLLTYKDFAG